MVVNLREKWGIASKKFRDKRTGEIVTIFPLSDIKYMEEVE